eukprot:scaffold22596_cov131-Cylindrotheca_fusiformis.AAC.18
MAKSIRSKCRRKARAEFRRTIGDKAYQKQQAQIQEKLKDCVEKQSMESLERLSNLFQTSSDSNEPQVMETSLSVDALETTAAVNLKGENKAPIKKSKKRKHALRSSKSSVEKKGKSTEKKRPKFFVQF